MNVKNILLPPDEIRDLFVNKYPDITWQKSCEIIQSINQNYDFKTIRTVYDDVLHLFAGSFPEYNQIKTPYHDLQHTLDVYMCAVRMLHGVHCSGNRLNDEEIALIMIGTLLHDIGYAQKEHEASGSGAQFTRTHIRRGIEFMLNNLTKWQLPAKWGTSLTSIIQCTDMNRNLAQINFSDDRILLCGQLVGSADLVGQMADRIYLEKLLFLYLEFKEAELGLYEDVYDLIKKTPDFYQYIIHILDNDLGGIYRCLSYHFKNWMNIDRDLYSESINKNISYLEKVLVNNKDAWFDMLKRHGIVKSALKSIN